MWSSSVAYRPEAMLMALHRTCLEYAMYRLLALPAAALLLSACNSAYVTDIQPIDGVISGQCHVDTVRGAVGLAASPGTVERARVDSDSLDVNVVRGGEQADGHANSVDVPSSTSGGSQLTIETGRTNNITAIYCG